MTRQEIIERFCILSTKVGAEVFQHQHAHDCFCDECKDFQFSELIVTFIEDAVNKAIEQTK